MPPFFIVFLTLLGVLVGAKYVYAMLFKWFLPHKRLKKDYSLEPTISVLLPCYNEGKAVYLTIESISNSDYPRDKFEVIVVDDGSVDDSWSWIERAAAQFPNVRIFRNEENMGKSRSVVRALNESKADTVIGIDSDCIFARNTIKELVACYSEPLIGAVGGRVGVLNANKNGLTMAQTFVYYLQYHLSKEAENWTRTVVCISGCLFSIKRELMVQLAPIVIGRNWFGIHVNEGEDRFLTHQVLLAGYRTYLNNAAECWTNVPETFAQLFRQQTRWRRGSMRDFFMTIRRLPLHVRTLPFNAVYNMVIVPLAVIMAALTLLIAPMLGVNFILAPMVIVGYMGAAVALNFVLRRYNPEQQIKSPWRVGGFGVWSLVGFFLSMLTLLTFDTSTWGTRTKVSPQPGDYK